MKKSKKPIALLILFGLLFSILTSTTGVANSSYNLSSSQISNAQISGLYSFDLSKHNLVTNGVHIGEAGYIFKANDDIFVTKLGVPSLANALKSTVNLYEILAPLPLPEGAPIPTTALSLKASVEVIIDVQTKDNIGFNYATLSTPVALTKSNKYLIQMVSDINNYPMLYYPNGTDTTNSQISIISPSYSLGGATNLISDGANTVYDLNQPGVTFGTPNLIYEVKTAQINLNPADQKMLTNPGLTDLITYQYYGYLGCRFTVKEPLVVTSFGAPYIEGNISTTVKIFEYSGAATGNLNPANFTELSAGIVESNSATADENGYNYSTSLFPTQPITVLPGKNYILVLISNNNYEKFYSKNSKPISNSLVTVENSVYGDGTTYFSVETGENGNNQSFAKPTFTFRKANVKNAMKNPSLTALFGGSHTGYAGHRFTVNERISVTSLGAPYVAGNTQTSVKIFEYIGDATGYLNSANFTEIISAIVYSNVDTIDELGYNYSSLLNPSNPTTLVPGKNYVLVLMADTNYKAFYDKATKPVADSSVNILNSLYSDALTYFMIENDVNGIGYSYAKPTFKFTKESAIVNDFETKTVNSIANKIYSPTANGVFYPRLEKLSSGRILCVFDTNEDDQNFTKIKLVYSDNGGQSFSSAPIVIASESGKTCSTPELFTLNNGNIWCSYREMYESNGVWYTALKVKVSTDNGLTWNPLSVGGTIVSETNTIFGGVWEPIIGYIGENIVCMYANDGGSITSDGSIQYIQMKTYNPSTGWSGATNVSATTGSRDGMPVFTKMADGRYIVVFECTDLSPAKFGLRYKISSDGLNWSGERKIIYTPVAQNKRTNAPYVINLPNGNLLLSFQSDKDNINDGDSNSKVYCLNGNVNGNEITWSNEQVVNLNQNNYMSPLPSCSLIDDKTAFVLYNSNYPSDGIYYKAIDISSNNSLSKAIQNFDKSKFDIRNDFYGKLGFIFSPSTDITLTHLGAPYFAGATQTTEYIYKVVAEDAGAVSLGNTTLIGSAEIKISSSTASADGFNYTQLQTPLDLKGGEKYIVVLETSANYPYFYHYGILNGDVTSYVTPDWGISISTNVFFWDNNFIEDRIRSNTIYGTPNFLYRQTPKINFNNYKQSGGYISNISKNTTAISFVNGITKVSSSVTLKNGSTTLANSDLVATGTKVYLELDGQTTCQTAIIYGDVDKTGTISVSDLALIKLHLLKSSTLTGIAFKAADLNKKNSITISDLIAVKKEILGLSSIDQNK